MGLDISLRVRGLILQVRLLHSSKLCAAQQCPCPLPWRLWRVPSQSFRSRRICAASRLCTPLHICIYIHVHMCIHTNVSTYIPFALNHTYCPLFLALVFWISTVQGVYVKPLSLRTEAQGNFDRETLQLVECKTRTVLCHLITWTGSFDTTDFTDSDSDSDSNHTYTHMHIYILETTGSLSRALRFVHNDFVHRCQPTYAHMMGPS